MIKKTLISATVIVIMAGLSLFAAEKAKEKKEAQKPAEQSEKAKAEKPARPGVLLDELIAAYKANDREKMGQVIKKMEAQREKMKKLAQLNKWHKWAHRSEMMKHRGWGQGPQWGRGCGPALRDRQHGGCCCPMNFKREAPPPCMKQFKGNPEKGPGTQMQRRIPGWRENEGNWEPPGGDRSMRGFGHGWGRMNRSEGARSQDEPHRFAGLTPDDPERDFVPTEQDW